MVMPTLAWLTTANCPLVICGKPFAKPLAAPLLALHPQSDFIALTGSAWPDALAIRRVFSQRRTSMGVSETRLGLLFPDSLTSAITFRLAGIASLGHRDDARSFLLRWPVHKSDAPLHAVLRWYRLACIAAEQWQLSLPKPYAKQPPAFRYQPPQSTIDGVQHILHANNVQAREFALIAPTATGLHRGQIKVWPGFAELTEALVAEGYQVLACPPAHEREQTRSTAPGATLLDPMSLDAFSALTRMASVVICNDSGVSHIAALSGANQITLFGVTAPEQTGPWSDTAICLGSMGAWPSVSTVLDVCSAAMRSSDPVTPRPVGHTAPESSKEAHTSAFRH